VKVTGKPLSDGMNLLFFARLKHDAVHGLTLQIEDVDAEYELGQMAVSRQLCIDRLKTEGLFYQNKTLVLPTVPQRIAIISVQSSKGYSDFVNIIESNKRNFGLFYMLFPSLLQGDAAVDSIISQLDRIRKVKHHFDAVAIIRGGGGDVGLSCYDDFQLASAIATFPLPVISGIGHSTNQTVVEMVANYNPITPTDLAYFILRQFEYQAQKITDYQNTLVKHLHTSLAFQQHKLQLLSHKIQFSAMNRIGTDLDKLNRYLQSIKPLSKNVVESADRRLRQAQKALHQNLNQMLQIAFDQLRQKEDKQALLVKQYFVNKQVILQHIEEKVKLLNPKSLLKRGFSLTFWNGKPLNEQAKPKPGDRITTVWNEGKIESIIEKIENYEN
jgi:exodeoxyribonuclease VII large subunit